MTNTMAALQEAFQQASLPALKRALANAKSGGTEGLAGLRIFILRNHMLDNFSDFLKAQGLLDGIDVQVKIGDYDVVLPYLVNPSSALHLHSPQIIFLSWVLEGLVRGKIHDEEILSQLPLRCQQEIEAVLKHTSSTLLVHTLSCPVIPIEGALAFKQNRGLFYWVEQTNKMLMDVAKENPKVFVIDIQSIEKNLGRSACFDQRMWLMAKSLFTPVLLREITAQAGALVRAQLGKSKKCLVLDCDQTLWGGIIGEDGMDGITLGPDDYPGNMYYQLQSQILGLQHKGVILALCSKNNPEDVWQVLDMHPHCLIKRKHIAASRINWQDKANNLRSLAEELNLSLESFVFVDDNPMECAWVKEALPQVSVVQLPNPLWADLSFLARGRFFEAMTVTQEDLERTKMYQVQANRRVQEASFANMEDFLRSLDLKITVAKAQGSDVARVCQLTQKTNQFNLTTRRYSEADIAGKMAQGEDIFVVKVCDRFGDFGLVGIVIVKYKPSEAIIDTFLLSCRVLGRRVEEAVLDEVLKSIRIRGIKTVLAEYVPSAKNQQTQDFYLSAGFEPFARLPEGTRKFSLALDSWQAKSRDYMQVAAC